MAFRTVQALAPVALSRHAAANMSHLKKATSIGILLALLSAAPAARAAAEAPAPLGITWAGWKGDYRAAAKKLETLKTIGFPIVSFVPTYAYVGLDKIDLAA